MPIGIDTFAWRRDLIHLQRSGKTYFVTFATWSRQTLPATARSLALCSVVTGHGTAYFLHCAIVMPDHVHFVATPHDTTRLSSMMQQIKSSSAHAISKLLGIHRVWQREYFDRILRSDEDLMKKCEYVLDNPVRAGLCQTADEYPWKWRRWIEGQNQAAEGT